MQDQGSTTVLTQNGRNLAQERRRRIALETLRDLLADLSGHTVGRVSLRAGRMIIWLRRLERHEPALAIKLLGVVAFRDNGIAGTALVRGAAGDVGAWGRNLAEAEQRPEILQFLQLDLWNDRDPNYPQLQALARDVRVYQGAALAAPDRIWTS